MFTGFYNLPLPKGCKIDGNQFNIGEVYEIPGKCSVATCLLDNKYNKSVLVLYFGNYFKVYISLYSHSLAVQI